MSNLAQIQLDAALELIKEMGTIIRYLDENNSYCQYWILDGNENGPDYVPKAVCLGLMQ